MTIIEALQLIETGAGALEGILPGTAATDEEVKQAADLILRQVQAFQTMSGKPIDEVIALLTPEPDL